MNCEMSNWGGESFRRSPDRDTYFDVEVNADRHEDVIEFRISKGEGRRDKCELFFPFTDLIEVVFADRRLLHLSELDRLQDDIVYCIDKGKHLAGLTDKLNEVYRDLDDANGDLDIGHIKERLECLIHDGLVTMCGESIYQLTALGKERDTQLRNSGNPDYRKDGSWRGQSSRRAVVERQHIANT